jgi:hypothetical protein
MKTYEIHPLAMKFPAMSDSEIEKLAKDIEKHGLRLDLVLYEGKILDGRNRYLACQKAGVEPRFMTFEESDGSPIDFVWSVNDCRRHMSQSQRAALAVEFMPEYEKEAKKRLVTSTGGKSPRPVVTLPQAENIGKSREKAAAVAGVSPSLVQSAKKLKEESPEAFQQVKDGDKSIGQAKKEIINKHGPPPEPDSVIKDEKGHVVPKKLHALWNRRHEIQEMMTIISKIRSTFRNDHDKPIAERDPLYLELSYNSVRAALDTAYLDIHATMPYVVCPVCQGDGKDCRQCKGRGLIGKFAYDHTIPREYKK